MLRLGEGGGGEKEEWGGGGGGGGRWMCTFLMEGPEAVYSSCSPILRQTVKVFLCAGPASSVRRYWCATLLNLASSLTRHMGVFSLV